MKKYVLYKKAFKDKIVQIKCLPEGLVSEIWRPHFFKIYPKNFKNKAFLLWYIIFFIPILFNRAAYKVFIIRDATSGYVKHYSFVLPKCWKFPFMAKNELYVGPVWTDPLLRKRGLTSFVLTLIEQECPADLCWVVRESNTASIIVAQKNGFVEARKLMRNRFGVLNYVF